MSTRPERLAHTTRRRAGIALSALSVSLATSGVARAQQLTWPLPSEATPPRLSGDSPAAYPPAALRDHVAVPVTVVLRLDVDPTGIVTHAEVTEARGHGFDEAALAAARGLRFDPASRDGAPVASKISFRYAFHPPLPRLAGRVATLATDRPIAGARVVVTDSNAVAHSAITAEDGSWSLTELPPGLARFSVTAPGKAPVEGEEDLAFGEETRVVQRLAPAASSAPIDASGDEIVVKGARPSREVAKSTLTREEFERSPGTNGDALQSLQNLPGIARPPPLSGLLIVRGSAPEDTNIYVGGTNIPIAYHFGGLASVVPTELLQKVDFYPGNFSAQYGRGMGGVVDLELRDPRKDRLHGLAQVDSIDVRLLAEGPIFDTGWSFLVAARRSNPLLDALTAAAASGVTTAPQYYDFQAMVQKDLSAHSSLRLTFFGSDDALQILNQTPDSSNPTFGGTLSNHTSFWRFQARYENRVSDRTEVRATAAFGEDAINVGLGTDQLETRTYPFSLRSELAQKLAARMTLNLGLDFIYEPYDLNLSLPPPTSPSAPAGGPDAIAVQSHGSGSLFLPGAYAELEVSPWRGMRVVPGVRFDYDSATKKGDLAPRIVVRQDLGAGFPRTTLKAAVGVFDQPPQPVETAPVFGQMGLASNRVIHYDVGVEQELTRQIDLSLDGFYKSFESLVVAGSGNSGSGFAYGVEWLLRYKPDQHFFGWISYTLSRSERRDFGGGPTYLFPYDQTHILTVLASYKLGRGWQVGARFRLVSGNMYTPTTDGTYDATTGSQLGVAAYPPYSARLPLFRQLDLRIDKAWTFKAWKLGFYVDVQNVTNAQNAEAINYNYNYTQSAYITGLPILPSLGVRAEF